MSTQTDTTKQPVTSPPRSRRRVLLACAAAVVAVVALILALILGNIGDASIVSGWVPAALFWVTLAVCLIAVVLRRDVLREFAIGIPIGIAFIALLFVGLHLTQAIPTGAPRSMYTWLGVACLMAGLVVAGWRRAHWPRRIAGLAAIVLAVVSAGSAVNQTFVYYTTFNRLLGESANHFLDNAQLTELRKEVAKSGKLPDHGATLAVSIPATNLKFTPRQAYVWVPPAWFGRTQPKLPVIELLHGTPGDPSNWTKSSYADATSLAFAEKHNGIAPILVMPDINGSWDGDTECVNSSLFGAVETYLTKTVPAFMQKNFNAETTPGSMAIGGLSEGGLCAVTLALNNSKQFPVFASYSGDASPSYNYTNQQQTTRALFGGSEAAYNAHNPPYLLAQHRYAGMAGWFEVGQQDTGTWQPAHEVHALATKAGINTCLATPQGGHDFAFWQQAFSDSLPWISWKLKLTPQPQSVPATCTPGQS